MLASTSRELKSHIWPPVPYNFLARAGKTPPKYSTIRCKNPPDVYKIAICAISAIKTVMSRVLCGCEIYCLLNEFFYLTSTCLVPLRRNSSTLLRAIDGR